MAVTYIPPLFTNQTYISLSIRSGHTAVPLFSNLFQDLNLRLRSVNQGFTAKKTREILLELPSKRFLMQWARLLLEDGGEDKVATDLAVRGREDAFVGVCLKCAV